MMRKAVKVLGFTIIGLIGLLVLGAGAWYFVMSNVEQPKYRVVLNEGAIELRDYPPLIVAEVTRRGERRDAVRAGFRPLASYIFAKEREGGSIAMTAPVTQEREQIAMTAPVTQSPSNEGTADAWVVRFVMPAEYGLETLPPPANPDVQLRTLPESRRAAIRFSGVATDELIAEQEGKLRAWLAERGLTPAGAATYAYYNHPLIPGFLRRNEVIFELTAAESG